jgi:hypothetical protein
MHDESFLDQLTDRFSHAALGSFEHLGDRCDAKLRTDLYPAPDDPLAEDPCHLGNR